MWMRLAMLGSPRLYSSNLRKGLFDAGPDRSPSSLA